MFEGNPINRSAGVKVMVWVNCVVLIFTGIFGFIGNIFNFLNIAYPILAFYIFLFGLISTSVELGIGPAAKRFALLTDWLGSAFFFFFVGTIGVSFFSNSLLVFIGGVYSCFVGCASFVDHFACKPATQADVIRPR